MTQDNFNEIEKEESQVNLQKILQKYLIHWKWFVVSIISFLLLGSVYLLKTTPLYDVKASILIKDSKSTGPSTSTVLDELDLFSSKKTVENEIEILRSYTLLEQVVKDLNLCVQYTQKNGLRDKLLYADLPIKVEVLSATDEIYEKEISISFIDKETIKVNKRAYPKNAIITGHFGSIRTTVNDSLLAIWDINNPIEVRVQSLQDVVEHLHKSINIAPSSKGTSVLNLSFLSPVPERGKDILNHLLTVYNSAAVSDKNNLIGTTLAFIDDRLKFLSVDLQDAEKKVEEFKSSQGITDLSAEAQLFLQSAQLNDQKRNEVEIQLSVLKGVEQYVLREDNSGGTTPATLGISDPTLLSLISTLTETEAKYAAELRTMKSDNPLAKRHEDQINRLKGNIIDNIQLLRKSLEITQKNLNSEDKRLEMMILSLPGKERQLVDITRQQIIKDQLYVYLLSKREETAISYASTVADSRIIDAARSTTNPIKPAKKMVMLVFALLGFLFPVAVLWIKDFIYDKITSKSELEKKLKVPLVGEIAFLKQATRVIPMTGNSQHAEQIRSLRTNLKFMMNPENKTHVILITSSISGEGKSFMTMNLGAAFAIMRKRTLIIGGDLRRPGLHKVVGIENKKGLSNYLAGQNSLKEIIYPVENVENLDVITCGDIPPNPQELLLSPSFSKLFEELKSQYEYVIIDTPPVGLVSDAIIMSDLVDISIYVIRQNYTTKDRLSLINELHDTEKIKNLCVVANGIDPEQWSGYYGYYRSKYYGQYYEEVKEVKGLSKIWNRNKKNK